MKKILFTILVLFASCSPKQQVKFEEPKELAIVSFVEKCFKEQPNAMNNEATRKMLADTLSSRIMCISVNDLKEVPMKYDGCLEYPNPLGEPSDMFPNAGKYLVKFSPDSVLCDGLEITFQVFTIMEKEQLAALVDGETYTITGTFKGQAENFKLPSERYFTDKGDVSKSSLNGNPFINLGTFILEDVTAKPRNQ